MTGVSEVGLLGLLVAAAGALFAISASLSAWRRLGRLELPVGLPGVVGRGLASSSQIRDKAQGLLADAPLARLVSAVDGSQTSEQARADINLVLSDVDARLRFAVGRPGPAARVALTSGILGAVLELIRAAGSGGSALVWALSAVGVGGTGALLAAEASRRVRRTSERLRQEYDALVATLDAPLANADR